MEQIEEFFELMSKYKDYLVIVEGKNDKRALEELGFKRIRILNKALYKVVEEIMVGEKVLILTDLDKEGKKLYGALNSGLTRRGVLVDSILRSFLFRNSRIKQIEGLGKLSRERLK